MPTAFRTLLLFCIGLCCALAPMGCTNDTSLTTGAVTRAVTFSIEWGRTSSSTDGTGSTAIQAPSQAKFARLTLQNANPENNKDVTINAPRPITDEDKNITQTYPVNRDVKVGPTFLVAVFYAEANPPANAVPIGMLSMNQTINAAPTTISISTVIPVTSVVVTQGQRIVVGQSLYIEDALNQGLPLLAYTASGVDTAGKTVPVPIRPKGAVITIAPGGTGRLSSPTGGEITGITTGSAYVSVTVTPDPDNPGDSHKSDPPELVTVLPFVHVAIDPATVTLTVRIGKQQFNAKVTDSSGIQTSDQGVQWRVLEDAGGTIDASGLYTAPVTIDTYHVVATSHLDPTVSATATIKIAGGSGSVIFQ